MIYEIVDTTDDKGNWNLAHFADREEALSAADRNPDEWGSDGIINDHATLEVRQFKEGWHPNGYIIIKTVEWNKVYDDEIDDNIWVIKNETRNQNN